jgi:uncharacterized delta-60 repeat protein
MNNQLKNHWFASSRVLISWLFCAISNLGNTRVFSSRQNAQFSSNHKKFVIKPRQIACSHYVIMFATVMAFYCTASAAPGDVDAGFNPNSDNTAYSTVEQPDGKIVIGGNFTTVGGVARNSLARLNASGTLDTAFNPNAVGTIWSMAIQQDGKIVIVGNFTTVAAVTRKYIARLNSDGTLDTSFNPNVDGITPYLLAVMIQIDGKIVIGGRFSTVGGVTRNNVARFNSDGTLDTGFNPNVNADVVSIVQQADGKIIIGGYFTTVGALAQNYIARLSLDGTLDTGFNPNVNSAARSIAFQADGKMVIGGQFSTVGGVTRNNLARCNSDGSLDTGFNPNVNQIVFSIALQADGNMVIGGDFTTVGAVTRNYIARVNTNGALDFGFNSSGANSQVTNVALQADGSILAGGVFTSISSVSRNRLARLVNDPAAQTLNVPSAGRIEWLRGGSSPETAQVTFELSTDAALTWTPLGNGTRISGGWELTGLSLPVGSAIRARARIYGGYNNASSGFVEAIAPFGDQPDITAEQPALTTVADGGAQAFGNVALGSNSSLTFTIRNPGGANLTGLGITVDGANAADFTVTASPTSPVTPAGTTTFTVQFTPTTTGAKTAAIHIANNVLGSKNPYDITLTGIGTIPDINVEQPALTTVVDSGAQAFGNVLVGSNSSLIFTIRNPGGANLTGLGITVDGANAADFTVTAGPTSPVAPAGTTTFTVQFTPTTTGAKTAAIHIANNVLGSKNPYDITLSGTGTAPDIAVEQPVLTAVADGGTQAFGNVLVGSNSSLIFTIRNPGGANLTGLGITVDGANAADFTVTANPTSVVAPTGTTTFTVRFVPSASGPRTAAIHIANNVAGSKNPYDVILTGTGFVTPDINVEQPLLTGVADGGTKAFGTVAVGSNSSLVFTIKNTGTADLTGLGITFDGTNAGDFSITSNPTTPVMAGATTTFTVQFAPTGAGARTAALHIVSNVTNSKNPYDISLTGTATAPDINVEQPALTTIADGGSKDFGSVAVGNNTSLTFTIRNPGTLSLSSLGITFDGTNASDFSVTTNPTSPVAVAGTTTFIVRFTPTAGGVRNAALHIASNVMGSKNPYSIVLTGTATTSDIAVEQPALTSVADGGSKDFGSVANGSNTSLTFTIRNTGVADLTGLTITRDGTNSAEFTVTTNPATTVLPGANTTFIVRFAPTGTGIRTAALRIGSNAPGTKNPYDINVTGIGVGPGLAEAAFSPGAGSYVFSTAMQQDGKIVIGGGFTTAGAATRNYLARLNADGTLDADYDPNANDWVFSTALQADGKNIIGGSFTTLSGVSRNRIARLNADGTLDTGFDPNANDWVYNAVVQPDGKIIVCGSFTNLGGLARNRIARLNADGTIESGFSPNVDGEVYTAVLQADRKIIIGGSFTAVDGMERSYIARLNSDGTLDANFNPKANSGVYSAAIQPDGKILIGGNFTAVGTEVRNRLARINADGTLDTLNQNVNGAVNSITLQTDGKVIYGGNFSAVGAVTRNNIARLNAEGTLDTTFNPNPNSLVFSVALQANGKVILGGDFTTVGGLTANRITRLDNDAATQNLSAPNSSRLQWLRGGSSPETSQVTFELSTDLGNTWSAAGTGVRSRIVSGWELSGLSLPSTGLIRARARTIGGYSNSSSGFVETVAAITGLPSAPDIVVEQPALAAIADSGTKSFGNVLLGNNTSLTFTVRNSGTANLTGLAITLDGTSAADFTIIANPTSPVTPAGNTSFTVRFTPTTSGVKTAALHISNNATNGKNPYDINLSGRALAPNGDDDADSISNANEIAVASLGFDPLVNNSTLLTTLQNNAPGLGLYTATSVESLAFGNPLLARDALTGNFHLSVSLEKSPNLTTWSPLLGFTPTFNALTGKIDLEITPDNASVQFYRILGAKP